MAEQPIDEQDDLQPHGPIRTFVAVPVPEAVTRYAEAVIQELRASGPGVRWTQPERMHVTLKFLGDTEPEVVPKIASKLAEIANTFSGFMVELGGVGAFPGVRRPQTLWLDVRAGEALALLAGSVDVAVREFGFPGETRPFRAHLTLGRVKSGRGSGSLAVALEEWTRREPPRLRWPVEEFHLMRSVLRPGGPEYTVLHRFRLRSVS